MVWLPEADCGLSSPSRYCPRHGYRTRAAPARADRQYRGDVRTARRPDPERRCGHHAPALGAAIAPAVNHGTGTESLTKSGLMTAAAALESEPVAESERQSGSAEVSAPLSLGTRLRGNRGLAESGCA